GWLAFFFLLGIYGYASRATTALTDMLLTCLLLSAWFMVYPQLDGEASWRRTFGAGLILGLAILTKGPIAIVLLALAAFIYLLSLRRNPLALARRAWPWVMLAVGCALAAMWYVPAFIAGRGSDLTGVFIDENLGHFLPASMGGTGEAARPVYYIVARMFGGSLPLSLLVPALIVAFAAGGFTLKLRKPMLFQLAMALAVIVMFSAASAKRDDYILPALPSLAILFAGLFATGVAAASSSKGGGKYARPNYTALIRDFTAGAIAVVMLAVVTAAILYFGAGGSLGGWHLRLQTSDATYAAILSHGLGRLAFPFVIFICGVALGAFVIFAGLWRGRIIWTGAGLALICLAGTSLWTGTLRPEEARTRSLNFFAAEVRNRVGATPVYVVSDNPGLAYYYGRAVPSLPRAVKRGTAMPVTSFYLVARRRELAQLAPALRSRLEVVSISHVMGGGGPPVLYLFARAAASGDTGANARGARSPADGLNRDARSAK
ncbi:MAG: ArnT family glycosyltransferase, partial [Candidatus Binataceae bacterium]